jgi:hypothetical protein
VTESTNILWAGLFFRMGWDVNVKLYATSLQLYFSSLPAQKFQMIRENILRVSLVEIMITSKTAYVLDYP